MARAIARDRRTGRLFTVTAGYSQPAPRPDGTLPAPVFHPDSFKVIAFRVP